MVSAICKDMTSEKPDPSLCQRIRSSKAINVGIVWATLALGLMTYGVLVPLLPIYVQELNATRPGNVTRESSNKRHNITTEMNATATSCGANQESLQSGTNSRLIGTLVSLQQWTQLIACPFAGPIIDKIGYDIPLFFGFAVIIGSAIGFAFVEGTVLLFILRGAQGFGAAFANTAGMTIISHLYKDDDESRGVMIGYALCGVAVGLAIGPPLGSVMYAIGDVLAPFFTIAVLTFIVALVRLFVRLPRIESMQTAGQTSAMDAQIRTMKDPYVLTCALLIVLGFIGMGFVESTLPLHMVSELCAENWKLGVVFLPIHVGLMIATPICGWLTRRIGRWAVAFISYVLTAVSLAAFPFCKTFLQLLMPGVPLGMSMAARNAAVTPVLAFLVDKRIGQPVYGTAYALCDIATSLAFAAGPLIAGILVPILGYSGTMYIAAGSSLLALIPMAFMWEPLKMSTTVTNEETTQLLPERNHVP